MIRRYGDPIDRSRRYRLRPGAYAILPRGGQILLTYQDAPHYEHQLPGGGIDPGESPIIALHREVYEETGWKIATPRFLGAYRRFTYMPEYDLWAQKLCRIYVARPVMRLGAPTEPDHRPVWTLPETALGVLASEGDAAMLGRFLL